jgi:hypothetical protein
MALVRFWDFTGYSMINTEPIPEANSHPMRWYRDSAIYTPELGEVVMARILGRDSGKFGDFGVRVTGQNLQQMLADKRARREIYARDYPNEVADVQRLVQTTRKQPVS